MIYHSTAIVDYTNVLLFNGMAGPSTLQHTMLTYFISPGFNANNTICSVLYSIVQFILSVAVLHALCCDLLCHSFTLAYPVLCYILC